jgi:hypothetical protein
MRVSSAPPINVIIGALPPVDGFYGTQAEIVPGQPSWILDRSQPSGTALNPAAFSQPPAGQVGDLPRNSLRSPYSINQTDVALRRRFNLGERVKLDVRAEYFNVFNHPMFGLPGSQCAPDDVWSYGHGQVKIQTLARCVPQRTAMQGAAKGTRAKRTVCAGRPALGAVHAETTLLRNSHPSARDVREQ